MWQLLKRLHLSLKAQLVRYFRSNEIIRVLKSAHKFELSTTPVELWALKKVELAERIASVRAGKYDIVDRRSWSFPYIPESLHRLNQPILKNTPYSLRRFSETPIPRRAVNLVKEGVLSLQWQVIIDEKYPQEDPQLLKKRDILEATLNHPNNDDSYQTLMEAVVEDFVIGGYGTMEPQLTPHFERPFKLWAVDGTTIRVYPDWRESTPDKPRYAQMTGLKGERAIVNFYSDELVYVRDNVRSNTPFGLGKLEVCFLTVNAFLGAQDMATKAGADQVHKTWLWWKNVIAPGHLETVRRQIQNELEGQAKISTISGLPAPELINVQAVTPEDLLLDWQEFLIRIIAAGFGLSAMSLGIENDVNRSTAEVLSDADFASAVVPVAKKFQDAITRDIFHKLLGWKEFRFKFLGLDDADAKTQVGIFQQLYTMNSLTPDQIRDELQLGGPLPGGWGKLTSGQMQLLIASASKASQGGSKPPGQGPSMGMGGGGSFGSGGGYGPSAGGYGSGGWNMGAAASLAESPFNAQDVAQMQPDELQQYQQAGLLPMDTGQLQQDMETEQPGILEQITDQLKDYFAKLDEDEVNSKVKVAKVTSKDEKQQQLRYKQKLHVPTQMEQWQRTNQNKTRRMTWRIRGKTMLGGRQ